MGRSLRSGREQVAIASRSGGSPTLLLGRYFEKCNQKVSDLVPASAETGAGGSADAGAVGAGLAGAGAAALAARLAAHDRHRDAGDAVLLYFDVAQERHVAG